MMTQIYSMRVNVEGAHVYGGSVHRLQTPKL